MFADIGHGLILIFISLFLIFNNNSNNNISRNNSFNSLYKYTYFFLICGIYSVFCGFMFNEFLSVPFDFFGSCYNKINNNTEYVKDKNCNYIFGLDPKILLSSNELIIVNSLKMKLSVIIGVIQMTFGIILKGVNDLLFKNYLNFFFEFIPQIIFMSITFGYMIFMIFFKWLTDWTKDTSNAPSILTIMMNMILKFGKITGKKIWNESELSINKKTLNYNFKII